MIQIINKINKSKYKKSFFFIKKKKKINNLNFGNFGLKIIKSFFLKDIHFNLLIKYLNRKLKKIGVFWFKCFPNMAKTKKSLGTRMGGGTSNKINNWGIFLEEGKIFLEILSIYSNDILKILKYCIKKLPKKLKIIYNLIN